MSAAPQVRRADRAVSDAQAREFLAAGFCCRLATVSADGSPYCLPLLYVVLDGTLFAHNSADRGHLRANVEHDARVCVEVDEPGPVFDYGRFECDTGLAYRSVIGFGTVRIVDDRAAKQRFFKAFMAKYGTPDRDRPRGFFPRLDKVTVYAVTLERLTGKATALPPLAQQWPALDRTASPDARAP
jgi:nitroimidazol reductase NimA-like FMN-containing flavoprotein (pyridoxamine 5'-phosphate oxidase superfamily)